MCRLPINVSTNALRRTQDLLDRARQTLGKGLVTEDTSNLDCLVKREGTVVDTSLLLLAVTSRLLESLDDEGRGRGDNGYGCLTVLDGELDGDTETLPVGGGLGDVFSDLLGRLWVGEGESDEGSVAWT